MVAQLHSGAEIKLREVVNCGGCGPPTISPHSIMPGFIWVLCSFLSFNIEDNSGTVPKQDTSLRLGVLPDSASENNNRNKSW